VSDLRDENTSESVATHSNNKPTLSVGELADLLGISVAHAYKSLSDGTIPCRRLGTRYLISRYAVLQWLDTPSVPSTTPGQ
jgi:excisionase family DNA binding protein